MVCVLHLHQHCGLYPRLVLPLVQRHQLFKSHVLVDLLLALWRGRLWPNHLPAVNVLELKIRRHCIHNHLLLRCPPQQGDLG